MPSAPDNMHHISTPAQLQELFNSTTYVAIDFTATWCGPCKAVAPVYANLAKKHGIPDTLAFAKVDVDEASSIAQQYGISAMPAFMFFKDGKQVAVNGQAMIRGADTKSLTSAVEKLGGLAKARRAGSSTA